jgi:metallophosphoesterase (TIGR03768 family)
MWAPLTCRANRSYVSSPWLVGAGPVDTFVSPPKVVADPDRRSLTRAAWMNEFFTTSSNPPGHGFVPSDVQDGFACYSFVPKAEVPVKVIVLDDTQRDGDGEMAIHGHGFLDQRRYAWLKAELASGDAANQLMIIAAHIPIAVEPTSSKMGWSLDPQNAVTIEQLLGELQSHPNLLMWLSGHRHFNTIKAFLSADPVHAPENGFWQVETSSLRDFPQQFRTFEIQLNSDYTISIVTTNVDPAVEPGTPAAKSRSYAVATQQIVGRDLSPNLKGADPTLQGYPAATDPSIKSMLPSDSYNATLHKRLSPAMVNVLKALFPASSMGGPAPDAQAAP